jgi:hypothetical protein
MNDSPELLSSTKYSICKSPITNKFGVTNSEGQSIIPFIYDIILDIIDDKYFIVGKKVLQPSRHEYIHTHQYGLIDINSNIIIDIKNYVLYIKGDVLYIGEDWDEPLNKKTLLGQYIWENKLGTLYLNYTILYQTDSSAIYKDQEGYKKIDCYGNILEKADRNDKEWFYRAKRELYWKPGSNSADLLRDFGGIYSAKWKNFEGKFSLEENPNRLFDITLSINEQQSFYLNAFNVELDTFLCICRLEGRRKIYTGIFNENLKLLYYDEAGFSIQSKFRDRLIINNKLIIDKFGKLYNFDSSLGSIWYVDENDYALIINNKETGYINNCGEIVVPIIFPDSIYEKFEEDYKSPFYSPSEEDAYEGDSDALWNTD